MAKRKCTSWKMTRAGRRCAGYGAPSRRLDPSYATFTPAQKKLWALIAQIAKDEGTDYQGALRDLVTDLMHLADAQDLNFEGAVDGAEEVYAQEQWMKEGSF